ncbi:MAG: FecR domain-containing protein [Planctomycetales bacterium]|nr:FecR domain-containing protein [Planctomycetales bacterium]
MSREPHHLRAIRAIGDLCNEAIEPSELAWLEERLCSDAEVRAIYLDYLAMHACLHMDGALLNRTDEETAEEYSSAAQEVQHQQDASRLERGRRRGILSTLFGSPLMLAASLALVALVSSLATYSTISLAPSLFRLAESVEEAASEPTVVARITGTHNCLWGSSSSSIGYGSGLIAGQQLELREGLAELTFENGATVLLESPATFTVSAAHAASLEEGRLAAVVPQQSRGFRIHTRSLEVFDVGAEFGLFARQSGTAEVHVFNGLVKANVLDSSGRSLQRLDLNASEAARVNPVSTTVMEFPANQADFTRRIAPSLGPSNGLLAYEGFDYPEGPLSAQNGGFGWAGPWFDISADEDAEPHSNRVNNGSLATKGLLPLGNSAMQTGTYNRIRRSLGTSVGGVFDVAGLVENQDGVRLLGRDGHQIYISFLQRVSQVADGFYGVELHRGDGNSNRVLSIGNGAEGTGYGATSIYNGYDAENFPSLGEESNEANMFVVKITFGFDNQDVVEVFRNPVSLKDEKVCTPDAVLRGNFAFDRISMANFDGSKIHEMDEIHVGTHFLAVTGHWGGERGRALPRVTYHSQPFAEPTWLIKGLVLALNSMISK